jgi:hypothetical protein
VPGADTTRIDQLTSMRCAIWRQTMEETGYSAAFPAEAAAILDGIANGIPVDFEGERVARDAPNLPVEEDKRPLVTAVIDADVASLKKAGPFDEPPLPNFVVSPIGCVPKKSGGIRVIHHLSYPVKGDSVNAAIVEKGFALARFSHAAHAIAKSGRWSWLIKLDVEAAYKQVPVRPEDWHLLGFRWNSKFYYERVLPFGLKSSCRLWDLFAAALHFFFEARGVPVVIHYIDDFLFVLESDQQQLANELLAQVLALCAALGIPMAPKKTEGPTHILVFLGILLDTGAMTASLPADKLTELRTLTKEWLEKSHASKLETQQLVGKLAFATGVVRPGRFFLRRLWAHAANCERLSPDRHAPLKLTLEAKADVAWWSRCIDASNGVSLLHNQEWAAAERIELFTDACGTGYGGFFAGRWFAGRWDGPQLAAAQRAKRLSMPFLELLALVTAAAAWGHLWERRKITFRSDCMTVVFGVEKRPSRTAPLAHLLRELAALAALHHFDFRCEHVAGVANVTADILSRDGDCPAFRLQEPAAAAQPCPIIRVALPPPPPPPSPPPSPRRHRRSRQRTQQ